MRAAFSAVFVAGVMLLLAASPALGATYTVTVTSDSTGTCTSAGPCSLRQAIDAIDATPSPPDTINLPSGSYQLLTGNGQLSLTQNMTIVGAGARSTTVSMQSGTGVTARVFDVGSNATVSISGVTVSGGKADATNGFFGGDIRNAGSLTLTNDTIRAGAACSGAGLSNDAGTMLVDRSTVAGNHANCGGADSGGIQDYGDGATHHGYLTVRNSTVSSNTAGLGGGVFSWNDPANRVTIQNSTIAFNSATAGGRGVGGLGMASGTASVKDTIISGNTFGTSASNCSADPGASITSAGYNLESGTDCGLTATGDIQSSDPQLGTPANNGGPTNTDALAQTSPAIDKGSPDCPAPATDQRGVSRPQGNECDIGAYELVVPGAKTFISTGGEQTFVVPARVQHILVTAVGGAGGGTPTTPSGGRAAGASAELSVTPGSTLYLEVGGAGGSSTQWTNDFGSSGGSGGFNGGAAGGDTSDYAEGGSMGAEGGGGGGGASDLRTVTSTQNGSLGSRLIVAAGGGGAGGNAVGTNGSVTAAGGAGGDAAGNGADGSGAAGSGGGGAAGSTPGSGGIASDPFGINGFAGTAGTGGAGGGAAVSFSDVGGGGGAGGVAGGGGGAGASTGGGGGGGSSLVPPGGQGPTLSTQVAHVLVVYAGAISGSVTNASSAPLSNLCVQARDGQTNVTVASTRTDAGGRYTLSALPAGSTYTVYFYDCANGLYVAQYYLDQSTFGASLKIAVEPGQTVTGINAQLVLGGRLAGSVTAKTSGSPLAGICVSALNPSTGAAAERVRTNSAGAYALTGLAPGSFKVGFKDCSGSGYLQQFYDGQSTFAAANQVGVTAGSATTGINAALS